MSFGLDEATLEWGLGARPLSLTYQQSPIAGPYMFRSGFGCRLG